MSVNRESMLPEYILRNELLSEILNSIDVEFTLLNEYIEEIRNELSIVSAGKLLPRYEKIFAAYTENPKDRIRNLIAKINMAGAARVKDILDIVKVITGKNGKVTEHYDKYSFDVTVNLFLDANLNILYILKQRIEEIKPSHLAFNLLIFIENVRLINKNGTGFKSIIIGVRNNNFNSAVRYLDGYYKLDGSFLLDQRFNKKMAINKIKATFKVKNINSIAVNIV